MRNHAVLVAAVLGWFVVSFTTARAEEIPEKYEKVIRRGLDYLARSQHSDGHWEANGGQYPSAMTGLAGIALLAEGSTVREGKYAKNIRRAVDWFKERSQRSGLLGDPRNPSERSRYMYGHGFGLLFLSQVYGEEEDARERETLEKMLTKAVEFCGHAQTSRGGWGYVSARDGSDFDEGSVTITQVQALRAARNAGIVVPKQIIDKARDYLKKCTTQDGGIIYSLANGGFGGQGRPALTAAAVACAFSAGEYDGEYTKRWLKYCHRVIGIDRSGRDHFGHWEYTHYYFAQSVYSLGDDRWQKLFPNSNAKDGLTWSKYKEVVFPYIVSRQSGDGSWNMSGIGPVYTTSCMLTILQLDRATLPIYQR
ncbi:MAG: hypothetical protein KatS3mg105_1354 [Gemmatales bacterium]|nr:MAG: hypothetical protein KatS3mg105_1354 [Gemmatales bacterium]